MRVLKWVVPVDDEFHEIGWGQVVHTECQHGPDHVMVWTEENEQSSVVSGRRVRVFGTGHPVPNDLVHVGSTMPAPELVWHVYGDPYTAQWED